MNIFLDEMQNTPQSVSIKKLAKEESFRVYENFIEDNFGEQIENQTLAAKLQVVGSEVIEMIYKLFSTPEFVFNLTIGHDGVGLCLKLQKDSFEELSALFKTKTSSDLFIKLDLIADDIVVNEKDNELSVVFEAESLYHELSENRIKTLKKYFKKETETKVKSHDSF